ncbi:MliC family protein [Psychrobacter sp. APC 3426]|uniref:MliC family protein n=1 Tax=Psychrobacter sp. APC 3426 TaxID=3035177 RepID=UPI0025B57709|nr:MliC family protein [Psychrobacter sp. APC 3426]MDN3398392.1 MliC family protein [Psychrobacter sp. APC 3426]
MRKLLIITPIMLLLAACATNAPMNNSNNTQAQKSQTFTCNDNAKVTAAYSANGKVANLSYTLPKLGLSNQKVSLKQAVSGSGARYVKESSSKASYEWQTKSNVGVLSIRSVNDRKYSVTCRL